MLTKFAVTNYRGFAEKIEWVLSKPNKYDFNSFAIKNGIVKSGIVYGSNGCGKTNLGLAVFDITNHISDCNKQKNYGENFVYIGAPDKSVEFSYEFNFDNEVVRYCYSKNSDTTLLYERLEVADKPIFIRDNKKIEFKTNEFNLSDSVIEKLRCGTNKISIIKFLCSSVPLSESHYLIKLQRFVDSMLWFRSLRVNEYIGFTIGTTNLISFIIEKDLETDFSAFLYEVSGQKFGFASDKAQKELYCVYNGNKIRYELVQSTGTESLLLLYYWIKKIEFEKVSFVFIDEFDAFYHFKLSLSICRRLFNLDCQVFLSSHNTHLMTNDLLRPDCNFLLGDNKIKPLSECTEKDLRWGHSIEKLYRGGTFNL